MPYYFMGIDAKHRPQALGSDVAGVGNATSGSITDKLTRDHRMTLDEARLILNVKKEDQMERILQVRLHIHHFQFILKLTCLPRGERAAL